MMFSYYKLNDPKYNGFIVKVDAKSKKEFYFNKEAKEWQPIGIMIRYFWPESETFEMYEELTENTALELIK